MNPVPFCKQCGAPLPSDAPGGACVPCLLRLGLTPPEDDPPAVPADASGAANGPELAEVADEFPDYRVLELLGEGGCGRVYLAEQIRPIRRQVALKVIKLGMDTRQVIARFEAERQALTLMDHPHIARLLGAGASRSGRPYFVMEWVRGTRLTQFCQDHRLTLGQRLELFVQVCQAVQHAHHKGIIHRDLKPSNVLVTRQDGVPTPKVIDFGIAKAIGQLELTDKTLFTAFERFLGTPAYMSPEQAGLGATDVDARSDIYSLGVLLYELLTGRPPFDAQELLRRGIEEIFFAVRESEPARPSALVAKLTPAERADLAHQRRLEPARFAAALRGDLDWIVMKALEKDRARRYETAHELALDIRRHLSHEPVQARPPSRLYRWQKTIRRHRPAFVAAAAVMLALLATLAVTTLALRRERAARQQEKQAAREARSALDFLQRHVIAAARPVSEPGGLGRDVTVMQALTLAERQIEAGFHGQPLAEATLRAALGQTYTQLGEYAPAVRQYRRATELRTERLGPTHPDTLAVLSAWALALQVGGSPGESVDLWRRAHAAAMQVRPRDRQTGELLRALAIAERDAQRLEDSDRTLRQALAEARTLLGPDDRHTLDTLNALGYNYWLQARLPEAATALEEVLARRRATRGPNHEDTTRVLVDLARVYQAQGRWGEARPMLLDALATRERAQGADHALTLIARDALAAGFARQHQWPEAAAQAEQVWRLREGTLGADHLDTVHARLRFAFYQVESVWLRRDAAPATAIVAQAREACAHLEQCVTLCDAGYPEGHRARIEPRCCLGGALLVAAAVDLAASTEDRLRELARAEQLLLTSWTAYEAAEGVAPQDKLTTAVYLARQYETWQSLAPADAIAAAAMRWQQQVQRLSPGVSRPHPAR